MKISAKHLRAFNARIESGFNEDYNKANGLPTRAEWGFMCKVQNWTYGMFKEPIKPKDIANYLKNHV